MLYREQHIPPLRSPVRPGEQQQPGIFQTNCSLLYCDYLFTFSMCCGCPPMMPDYPFLWVCPPLPHRLLLLLLFKSLPPSYSLSVKLDPAFTSASQPASTNAGFQPSDVKFQPSLWNPSPASAPASWAGKPSYDQDFARDVCREQQFYSIRTLFPFAVFLSYVTRNSCLCWGKPHSWAKCLTLKSSSRCASDTEIPCSQ